MQKFFYGWWIVVAAFINTLIGNGIALYTFSVFFKPLLMEFGWTRAAISGAHSAFALASGLAFPLMGKAVDHYGPRRVMLPGAIVLGLSYMWLFKLNAIWQLWAVYVVIGVGFAALTIVPCTRVVSQWFIKKRGRAIGLALAGVGMGGLIMSPLANHLISLLGWRGAYLCLGIIIWVVTIPTIVVLMKGRPEELGLLPDGDRIEAGKERPEGGVAVDVKPFTASMAFKTLRFWMLAIVYILYAMGFTTVFVHLVPLATDIGIKAGLAAAALGFTTGVGIFGKVGIGFLAEKINKERILSLSFMLMAIALIFLMVMKSLGLLYVFILLFGLGYSGGIVLIPLLSGEYFGLRSYGEIFGYLMLFFTLGSATGPIIAGYIFDVTRSYNWAFTIFIGGFILAAIAILFARWAKPKTA